MTRIPHKSLALLMVAATACAGSQGVTTGGTGDGVRDCATLSDLGYGEMVAATPQPAEFPWNRDDPAALDGFNADEIIPGGPPPDGIPPIDAPCFDDIAAADEWLQPQDPVMVVEVDGDRRAYPLAIMTQHEIVNDVIGGQPVIVTYCPLCNSGLAFVRTVDGAVLDFGTSGRLYRSNLVMYDRQTKSLWAQFTGEGIVGEDHVGTELERLSTQLLSWEEFRDAVPDGLVLSRQSSPGREYGRNPYPGHDASGDTFLYEGPRDGRLPPTTRVIGLGETAPTAIPLPALQDQRVIEFDVDDVPVTVWWAPGQASALDTAEVADGQDVGSTVAFDARGADGSTLTFRPGPRPDQVVDDQTGSTWNLLGEAVDGALAGTALTPVTHDDTFWFVWFAFRPTTTIFGDRP